MIRRDWSQDVLICRDIVLGIDGGEGTNWRLTQRRSYGALVVTRKVYWFDLIFLDEESTM
jgi:hypothetical protein